MAQAERKGLLARGWWSIPVVGACIVVVTSLASAGQAGFPLDDSWIHQDFARTLATTGTFAYLPGHSGAGSTSPLWVLLLLPPYWIAHAQPPIWLLSDWAALIGGAALAGLGIVSGWLACELVSLTRTDGAARTVAAALAGLACVMEWHVMWAAVSGMETIVFALVALVLLLAAFRQRHPAILGVLTALAMAIRPEGILIGIIIVLGNAWATVRPHGRVAFPSGSNGDLEQVGGRRDVFHLISAWWHAMDRRRWRTWVSHWLLPFGLTMLVGAMPYLLINLAASGHVFPSTLYAKSTFYTQGNFVEAIGVDLWGVMTTVIGSSPVVLLLGGLSYSHGLLGRLGRQSQAITLTQEEQGAHGSRLSELPLRWMLWGWALGLIIAYAGHGIENKLHGRYLIPMIPALIVLGAAGTAPLLVSKNYRLIARAGGVLLLAAGIFSAVRGVQIYSSNVRFINATQVAAALWLRAHAPAGAVVATHDIGAIGYFSGHRVVDVAGLADPELIPLLNDQPALESYLRAHHIAFVAIYINWFPDPNSLVRDLAGNVVYRAPGESQFVVYQTHW